MMLFQRTFQRTVLVPFIAAAAIVVLTSPVVGAQNGGISVACYNETSAILSSGKAADAYDRVIGDGGCDTNKTYESCTFDYGFNTTNLTEYDLVCTAENGVFYTYDYTKECPADEANNVTAHFDRAIYEPDCLGQSCTMEEAKLIFYDDHRGCVVNISSIEAWDETSGGMMSSGSGWFLVTLTSMMASSIYLLR